MKRNLISMLAIIVAGALMLTTSCKVDDTVAPVVTLKGDATMTIDFGAAFDDPGATATDDNDKEVTIVVEGTVNKDAAGEYKLIYKATDEAGNIGSAERTVYVSHRKSNIAGNYSVSETFTSNDPSEPNGTYGPFSATITAGAASNMAIKFNNFGDYGPSVILDATLTGNSGIAVTIPSVTTGGITFEGTGTVNAAGTVINVNYTANDGTFLYNYTAIWTKQ